MALFQAVVIGLLALIITPGYLFYFDVTPKVAVLLVGTAGVLVLAARGRVSPRGPRLFATLLVLNAGSLAVSTAFSTNRNLSMYGSTWRCFGALVQGAAMLFAWLVAWQCTGRPGRVRVVLRGVSITGIVCAGYGIAQYFGWDPLLPQATYRIGEGVWSIVRPPGTLGYASYFATWLLLTVFLSLALAKMETHRVWRGVARSAAALALAAMAMTGTRAALLGLLVGGAVWLFWSGFRLPRRAVIATVVVILCGAGFYYSPPGLQLRSRSRWFSEDPWGGARPLLWRDSFLMALQRPAAGYGPEVFLAEFPQYESKALAKAYPDFVHESPHNILLDALVAQGIPGFLLLCGLCAAGMAAAWRLKRLKASAAEWLAAALAAGIVSQQFTAFTVPTAVLFLIVIALTAGLATEAGTPRRSPVLAGVAPLLVLTLLYLTLRLTMADHALAATKRLLDSGNLRATTAEYEAYSFWHLSGPAADLWYSRSWLEVARKTQDIDVLGQAMAIAEQAAARSTKGAEEPFAAWYNLAQISALQDNFEATESSLRQAIAAHPNWFKPHWMLAQELQMVFRLDEAEKEGALAVELDGGQHAEVARTLLDVRARQAESHLP
jgi:O-antigen ligase